MFKGQSGDSASSQVEVCKSENQLEPWVFSLIFPPFKWPNNRVEFGGTEIWIWWQRSEISFLRVDTINLVSARNGKVGRIYFLIVMLVYGTVSSREGSIFSWLWLSPALPTTPHWPHGSKPCSTWEQGV